MTIIESIIYGLISGLAEFLPISLHGHQAIFMHLFGMDTRSPIQDLLIHIGISLSVLISCKSILARIYTQQRIYTRSRRRRTYDVRGIYDLRLIQSASIPMMAGLLLYFSTSQYEKKPIYLALFFLINGIFLIIPEYSKKGNKSAKSMSSFDGVAIGLISVLSIFPGISRIGSAMGFASLRGADKQHILNWAFLLSIPALVIYLIIDIVNIFIIGIGSFSFIHLISYLLGGGFAFCGGYMGIILMKFLTERTGYSWFAYYCWGVALFSFVLFLIA